MQIEKNNTVDREQRSSLILGTAFELFGMCGQTPDTLKKLNDE